MSKRVSFADLICPVEKGVAPHKYAVHVGGAFHSSHPSKRSAMAQAQDLLDDEQEDVSVRALKDEDEAEQYALRKSPRVKDEDEDSDDDEMGDDEKRARGVHGNGAKRKATRKVSFADVVFPGDIPARTLSSDIEDQPERGPRVADAEGERDPIGREYSDLEMMYAASGGLNVDTSPIPEAGAGAGWEGTSPDLPNGGFRPFSGGEGDRGRVGGEDRGVRPARPNLGRDGAYTMEREDVVPEGGAMVPARIGDGMRVMSPQASGIQSAADYIASEPTTILKSRRKAGLFSNVVNAPLPGSNRFDR